MVMTLALAQLLAAATPPLSLHLLDRPGRSLRLAQAPAAPLGEAELQRQVDELNSRIRATSTDWPLGAIIGAYFGFSAAAAIPVGLIVTLLGAVVATGGGGVVLIIGLILTGVGVAGLAVGIVSLVSGTNAQTAAKEERAQLVRQREELERELKTLRQAPPGVERLPAPRPTMLTLATF